MLLETLFKHNNIGRLKLKEWFSAILIKFLMIFVDKDNIIKNYLDTKIN